MKIRFATVHIGDSIEVYRDIDSAFNVNNQIIYERILNKNQPYWYVENHYHARMDRIYPENSGFIRELETARYYAKKDLNRTR